jgi:carbonic anhydrase
MKWIFKRLFALVFILTNSELIAHPVYNEKESSQKCNGQREWNSLQKGNRTFVRDPKCAQKRKPLAQGQNPTIVVLSCSDSRIPPESIFSKDLGKLFVIRTAGQVIDDVAVDTIEFAVNSFDVSLILVMGHSECGAVKGALNRLRENHGLLDTAKGHLNAVLIPIETAILKAGIDIYSPNALQESITANISYIANQLISQSPLIAKGIDNKRLTIVGAEYNLKSGKVKEQFTIHHALCAK